MKKLIGTAALAVTALGSAPATAGTASASTPHLRGCERSSVRPATFNPICNDGNDTVISLHWLSWSGTAQGNGKFFTHQGNYPVSVSASRVRGGNYTRFRYHFTHRVPHGLPRTWTIKYDSGRWHGLVV